MTYKIYFQGSVFLETELELILRCSLILALEGADAVLICSDPDKRFGSTIHNLNSSRVSLFIQEMVKILFQNHGHQ